MLCICNANNDVYQADIYIFLQEGEERDRRILGQALHCITKASAVAIVFLDVYMYESVYDVASGTVHVSTQQIMKGKRLNRVYPGRTTTYQGTLFIRTFHARS